MVTSVMESLRLFPCTLACLQMVVIEISITQTVFHPNTISAAWRGAERINMTATARVGKNRSSAMPTLIQVTFISIIGLTLCQLCLVCISTFRVHSSQSSAGELQSLQCVLSVAFGHLPVDVCYRSSH